MQKIEFEKSKIFNKPKIQTKRHTEIIESLEKMLEKIYMFLINLKCL